MDEIRIPNQATYSPIALTDVAIAAPLVSRLLLGATLPGRVLQAAALGAYVGSAITDWLARLAGEPGHIAMSQQPDGAIPVSSLAEA